MSTIVIIASCYGLAAVVAWAIFVLLDDDKRKSVAAAILWPFFAVAIVVVASVDLARIIRRWSRRLVRRLRGHSL